MRRCEECGFDWDSTGDEVITEIDRWPASYRAGLTRLLPGEDGEALVRTRPAPLVWSALEYTVHMRDVSRFYLERIQRVLAEDRPVMEAADFTAMAENRNYNDEDVEDALGAFSDLAVTSSTLLTSLEPNHWQRTGIGNEGDERTVLTLARRLAHDGHHHLLDVGRVLRTVRQARRPRPD
ncbi:MAG TPA: DinB family protein [Acidimicrobiales bacterium]|nr:DinB family protein [Acidimicrobiales bacterium]